MPNIIGRWAVLIGIDEYEHFTPNLNHCVDDIDALAEQLVMGGFEKDRIVVLKTKPDHPRYYPSKTNIERELKLTLESVGPNDFVMVAFAGHGVRLEERSYLCPADAELEPSTLLEVGTLYKRLEESRARFKLLIVDACQDVPPAPKVQSRLPLKTAALSLLPESIPPGMLLLASCSPGQQALEDTDIGHGIFSYYLVNGMKGEADFNKDGTISLLEWATYAADRTRVHARKKGRVQNPLVEGRFPDFDLAEIKEIRNSVGMTLVFVPGGEFQMGSGAEDGLAEKDEQPLHKVQISRGFFISRHEVSVRQFRQFVEDTNYKTDAERGGLGAWGYDDRSKGMVQDAQFTWRNPGFPQMDDHPVVNVSWNDAVAFCQWLSRKEGARYRLPTEAEWEYACRAGTTTRYFCGDSVEGLVRVANVKEGGGQSVLLTQASPNTGDVFPFTAPVGSLQANGFGLYDVHGNVAEWCADWYSPEYYRASPATDPSGPQSGERRVIRGGAWLDDPVSCRSAARGLAAPYHAACYIGFRVVKESD